MTFGDPFSTVIDVLHYRTVQQPDQIVYTFLKDGETATDQLTYRELQQHVLAIAAQLQRHTTPGARAILLYPPGLDYITAFLACLASGIIAVPAYPPRPNRPDPRLQAIAKDAQATLVLTNSTILANVEQRFGSTPDIAPLTCLATDQISPGCAANWRNPAINRDAIALLQYTSGSTGTPKGVMVSYGNLWHNLSIIEQNFGLSSNTPGVSWLPLYHDMGLIGNILQPIYSGFSATLMSPVAFLQKPLRWLQALTDYQSVVTGAPNFAYDLCVDKITPEQRATLDLSRLQVAFCGAEPVRAATITRFTAAFAECGFRPEAFCPCYGLAEATVFVAAKRPNASSSIRTISAAGLEQNQVNAVPSGQKDARTIVSCGQPGAGYTVVIVDPASCTRAPADQIGEIWVAGPNVAQGYWNQLEATAQAFHAYLADTGAGPFVRTGDLGCLQGNELFVTGRIKDLLIIRGRNYYPQDIEQTVEQCHPALQPGSGAAFSVEIDGSERLVIAHEVQRSHLRTLVVDELAEAIRSAVAEEHELQVDTVVFLRPGSIPKTSSGKLQRQRCRANFLDSALDVIGTWSAKRVSAVPFVHPPASPLASRNGKSEAAMQNHTQGESEGSKKRADDLIGWLREYATTRINSRLIDERRTVPPYIVMDFGNHGLFGLQAPEGYGGLALSYQDTSRVLQQLAAIDLTLAGIVGPHNTLGLRPLLHYANPALREELLPLLARGRELAAFGVAEPEAGADLGGVTSVAVPDGTGGWRLRGSKRWNGSAWAGVINVFVRQMQPDGTRGGLTGFVVRQGMPGLRIGPESLTMGLRGIMQNALYLDDVAVGPLNLLGELGKGAAVVDEALLLARLGTGIAALGGMQRCAQLMHRYATRRTIVTGRLLDNPVTLAWLSELTASLSALEALIELATKQLDSGERLPNEVAVAAKVAGSEFLWQAADNLVQLLGGRGYMENNLAPQILRDARALRIVEGPNESLTVFLGRIVSQDPSLARFLRHQLGVPHLADQLESTVQQIQARCLGAPTPFAERSAALVWAYNLIGELAIATLLLAAAQQSQQKHPAERWQRAVTWARLRFEASLNKALRGPAVEASLLSAAEATELIGSYAATIGDLEQTLPGEDLALDPLLRSTTTLPERQPLPLPSQAPPAPTTHVAVQTTATIQAWLVKWIATDASIAADKVDPQKTFLQYGFDSLKAVTLLYDLEKWLGRPLSHTLTWEYSTPAALAQYLAQAPTATTEAKLPIAANLQNSNHAHQPPAPNGQKKAEQLLAELEQLSEQEVDALLNTLLAEAVEAGQ